MPIFSSTSLRLTPTALVALALGFMTSIAVPLIIAYRGVQPSDRVHWSGTDPRFYPTISTDAHWAVWVTGHAPAISKTFRFGAGCPRTTAEFERFRRFASDEASIAAIKRHEFLLAGTDVHFVTFTVTSFGWPWPCLAMERAFTPLDSKHERNRALYTSFGGYPLPPGPNDPPNTLSQTYSTLTINSCDLPTRLLLSPLAANTAVYAAAWFPLLLLASRLRRALTPKSLCTNCRYSLTGLPPNAPCPECGEAQQRASLAATLSLRFSRDGA